VARRKQLKIKLATREEVVEKISKYRAEPIDRGTKRHDHPKTPKPQNPIRLK
jgi:hypothetical protein